jgi:hypothetical protein
MLCQPQAVVSGEVAIGRIVVVDDILYLRAEESL